MELRDEELKELKNIWMDWFFINPLSLKTLLLLHFHNLQPYQRIYYNTILYLLCHHHLSKAFCWIQVWVRILEPFVESGFGTMFLISVEFGSKPLKTGLGPTCIRLEPIPFAALLLKRRSTFYLMIWYIFLMRGVYSTFHLKRK